MKKIVIPTILVATILVAGMFAFMPVQKAATIHSSLTAGAIRTVTEATIDAAVGANTFTVTCNQPFRAIGVNIDSSDPTGDDTFALVAGDALDQDGTGALDAISLVGAEATKTIAAAAASTEAHASYHDVAVGANGSVSVVYTGVTAEVDATIASWQVQTSSSATCS